MTNCNLHTYTCIASLPVKTVEDNKALKNKLVGLDLPETEYVKIPLNEHECKYTIKPCS